MTEIRVGQGFDAHAFVEGRPLIIGGVEIGDHPGLAGHSDADVLCHAVTDALLGAAHLGDLGELFPADERWKDGSSLRILRAARDQAARSGWQVVNVDATVIAQHPRLAQHRHSMCERLADALGIDADSVSTKATSTDALGFVGRGEGIAALAVVLIERGRPDEVE